MDAFVGPLGYVPVSVRERDHNHVAPESLRRHDRTSYLPVLFNTLQDRLIAWLGDQDISRRDAAIQ